MTLETVAATDRAALTEWANPPKLSDLKNDLTDAKPVHSAHQTKVKGWLDNLNVTGTAKINVASGSKVVPKLIRKQAEWRYAALSEPFLSSDKIFKVQPVTWEDRKSAQQNQLVLNNQFNTKIKKVNFIDAFVRTAVDEGTVIAKLGWDFEEEEYKAMVPVLQFIPDPSMAETHQQLMQLKQSSPSEYATNVPDEMKQAHELSMENQVPLRPQIIGAKEETKTRTIRNQPTVEICDFNNLVIDPTCNGDLNVAGFIIHSFESSLSQLTKDGKYKNLDMVKPTGSNILNEPDHVAQAGSQSFNFKDDPRKKLVVFEYWGYWDIHGTGKTEPFVAAWVGSTLIRMEAAPFPDKKLPFVLVQYLPVRKSVYGEPDGVLIEDNQLIAGAVTRGMIDIMGKSANGQTGIRKDMLDTTNRRKFDKGMDYEFNANVDPRQGVHMHVYPEIPNSAQFMLQLQNMEAESLTGVKSFSGGISGSGLGDVAAGIRGALDAASKRELGILRRLSAGIVEIGRKIISMNAEFLEEEEVVRITNEEFVKVRRDDLAGNFDLQIGVSTAEEDEKKAQELAFMLQTMGNNTDQEMRTIILSDIARLRKMPELAEKIENYQPQPDPMAVRMQELQMALLEAQIATEQAKAASFGSAAQLSGAKVGTEQVKQGHIQADADQKTLNFVEQESGMSHAREMDKQGAQAKANGQLAVLQAALDDDNNDSQHKREINTPQKK